MAAGKKPSTNSDCILSANGYGVIVVPVIAIDYGPTIVAAQDTGRFNNVFYPMQVQQDTFSISAVFASKAGTNFFNRWIWQYVEYACAAGSHIAVGLRVQMPKRNFDMMGFPVSGWSYHWAPVSVEDVTWVITITFEGASPVGFQPWAPTASQFVSPSSPLVSPYQAMFYPSFYGSGNSGDGPPTGVDVEYNQKKSPK